jgi:hypothetical protein
MGTYLKHKDGQPAKKRQSKQTAQPQQPTDVVLTEHASLAGIEGSLDWIARELGRLTSDETSFSLSTAHNTNPVKITLADCDETDTMDRLVLAFERIADSVAKLAGLNRPRLESWHEQDEYVPRHKETACDGGAPGPKQKDNGRGRGV